MPTRDFIWLGCQHGNHDWQFIGGRNAGCTVDIGDCGCSVPVNECAKCGDCDYGDNSEADQVRAQCQWRL
jgi:hypothetical protein